ncbi:conserved hypothetical protein [Neospora caninum Liverpool]|uniref:Uncharacterized protein n=1 Tax=Neospora caninum (strain Liverpool) TaxID=572307 RepID=F0VR15_NEOCL|nr:conserved hypothetical protein [Neospora caninum Liverpool]CBZ56162.1 conserved hypothetical protein [Neospora caninum Liverpool]CEL70919.1 TPA: hypothetical protein BN1204_065880 [Neospora caninum Liverpool]|eukprot:XP_003886188.1 conserved hypothetical protein [Neospora caninum Liverpool]
MEFVIKEPLCEAAGPSRTEGPETFLEIYLAEEVEAGSDREFSMERAAEAPVPFPIGRSDVDSLGDKRFSEEKPDPSSPSAASTASLDWEAQTLSAVTSPAAGQKYISPFTGNYQEGLSFSLWSWDRTQPTYKPEELWSPWEGFSCDRLSDAPEAKGTKSHYADFLQETQTFIERARKPSALSLHVLCS